MKIKTFLLSGLMALAATFAATQAGYAASGNPSNALILISSDSYYDKATHTLHCDLVDARGNKVGSLEGDLTHMKDENGTLTHTFTVNGGFLTSTGPANDPAHTVDVVVPNGPRSEIWLSEGEHPLADYPNTVATGSLSNVSSIVNRCKFLVTFDENGEIEDIKCITCVYILS